MLERQYIFRRKLQVIALVLGGIAALFVYCHKAHAHVDLVHVEIDTIVREIMDDINDRMDRDREFCAYGCERDYEPRCYEPDNEPGVKHD